jgi:beta-phosphoglucomutase-like phosphatase (HAD superfamily)
MISAIIFDMDGVLIESVDVKMQAFHRLFDAYPEYLDEIITYNRINQGVSRYIKIPWIFENILHQPLDTELRESMLRAFASYVGEAMNTPVLVRGCTEFLTQYSHTIPCAVVSAAPEEEVREILNKKGIARHFTMILGSPSSKSDNMKTFLDGKMIKPDEAIVIGDSLTDYYAAREVGCQFIGRVPPDGENPFINKEGILCLVKDLSELESAVWKK